jgi:putative ABC transport system substrate-binding protein
MVTSGDPVGSRFVASLARSGNNVTGLSSLAPEISVKQLEIIKEIDALISQVTLFWNPLNPSNVLTMRMAGPAAKNLNFELNLVEVRTPVDLDPAFEAISKIKPQALLFVIDQVIIARRADVVRFGNSLGCPAMYPLREFVIAGGLMSFGFNFPDLFYRSASFVDKILKGTAPTELPIQQPTRFHLVINLATAKTFGMSLPSSILARADEVIE